MGQANEAHAPETKEERRQFLERIGKYAAVTPPAISLMLAASTVPAHAAGSSHASAEPSVTPSTSVAPAPRHRQSNRSADDRGRAEAGDRS
jgi:hypothetical protein